MILKPPFLDCQRQTFVGTDLATELPSPQQSQAGQQDGLRVAWVLARSAKDAGGNPGERRSSRFGLRSA